MPDDQEKRKLRLVVNNDPGYKLIPIEPLALRKIRRNYEEQIDNIEAINSWHMEKREKSFRKKAAIAALAVAAVMGIYISQYSPWNAPKNLILIPLTEDRNQDNVSDAYILDENRHKVPGYGLRINGSTIVY